MFLRCPNCRGIIDVHEDNIDFLARCGRCATLWHLRTADHDRGITARPLPRPGTVPAPSPYTPTGLFAQPTLANLPPVPVPSLGGAPSFPEDLDPIAELAALSLERPAAVAKPRRNGRTGRLLALALGTGLAGTFILSCLALVPHPGPQQAQGQNVAAPPPPAPAPSAPAPAAATPTPSGELFPEVRGR